MKELFKFEMPGLSKYWFYENGEAENKRTGTMLKPHKAHHIYQLYLWQDDGKCTKVTQKEIIHYGKHLQQVNEPRYGNYLIKIPSKINNQ